MTKLDAVKYLLSRFEIGTQVVGYDYDPAGSTREVVPRSEDLQIIETLVGHPITEEQLWFSVQCGHYCEKYKVREEILSEVSLKEQE